jgi:pyrroline-5-carboxylate reductase
MTGLYAPSIVSEDERHSAERVLQAAGETLWVDSEEQMDAITAVSGSGPAYVFLFIEALQQGAVELGFSDDQARRLAISTVLGSARLAAQSDEPAAVLRERVTSKGGTTEAALRVMAERNVKAGVMAGMHAAEQRGRELGLLLGQG